MTPGEKDELIDELLDEISELKSTIEKLETQIANLTPDEPDDYRR